MKKDKLLLLAGSSLIICLTGVYAYIVLRPGNKTSEPIQCAEVTQSGSQCQREALSGSKYCWQHQQIN